MGYIYCIKNQINQKCYIGKTLLTVEQRFKQHIRDSKKQKNKNRSLYKAFIKYGIDNFICTVLEEVSSDLLSNREIYWIQTLNSYGKNGYNQTKGGDGKSYIDPTPILNLYQQGYNQKTISKKLKITESTIRKILRNNYIHIRKSTSKVVEQYDLDLNLIQTFDSTVAASEYLCKTKNVSSCCKRHIVECCNNKMKSAYGYIWKYKICK